MNSIFTLTFTLFLSICCFNIKAQIKYYKSSYLIDNEKAQDQYYKIEIQPEKLTIQERGVFLSDPKIFAYAESVSDKYGYKSIEIAFNNGNINSQVSVLRSTQNPKKFYSYFNNELADSISVKDSTILLFDGPNPTFDALNTKILKEIGSSENELVLINWINGSLSSEKAYYTIGKNEVSVHKKRTNRVSFLSLDSNGTMPISCYQNKESYEFQQINSLPIELKNQQ